MTTDDLVTIRELAQMLATTARGVYHRFHSGELPAGWERRGRHVVWPRAVIDEWMEGDGARIRETNQLYARARASARAREEHHAPQDGREEDG